MNTIKERNIIIDNPETKSFLADCFYPDMEGQFPLLIFAHGYKGYKDWGTFDLMADEFAKAGFVFVKFNFSHNGTTIENPKDFDDLEAFGNNTYSKEMSDYQKVIDHFEKHPKVDASKIILIGHSRGGGNTILQAYKDNRVKALITLASIDSFAARFPKNDRLEDYKQKGVFYVENARTKQQMPHYYSFYEDFKKNEETLNIQFAAQHLKKSYLIVHGTNDEAVKSKTADLLHSWAKNSELLIIQDANHTFGGKEPWNEPILPIHLQEVTEYCTKFLKNIG